MCSIHTATLPGTKTSPAGDKIIFGRNLIGHGVLTIRQKGGGDSDYSISTFHADGGQGFHFEKLNECTDAEADSYDVFLPDAATADAGMAHDSCECKGFLRHGHCKHVEAAYVIAEGGWLFEKQPTDAWFKKPAVEAKPAAKPVPKMPARFAAETC